MGYSIGVTIGVTLYCSIWTSFWNILMSYFIYSVVKVMEPGWSFIKKIDRGRASFLRYWQLKFTAEKPNSYITISVSKLRCHVVALILCLSYDTTRGGSSTAATSKMERFVITVNGFQPLTIITKCSILDVAAALDPSLTTLMNRRVLMHSVKRRSISLKSYS